MDFLGQLFGTPTGVIHTRLYLSGIPNTLRVRSSVMLSMQSSGSAKLSSAVGKQGSVYLTVPPGGTGKVQVDIGGHLKVVDASSDSDEELKTGDRVEVVRSVAGNTLVVRKV